jgi:hypothetical protein
MSPNERLEGGLVAPMDKALQQLCVRLFTVVAPEDARRRW